MFVSPNPKHNVVANSNEIITWFYNGPLVEKSGGQGSMELT
jgi:hypothetical protein